MTSKEKLNSIESLINEFYHDMKCKGNLNDCANECWKEYQEFCEDIKQDLERLEKLEQAKKLCFVLLEQVPLKKLHNRGLHITTKDGKSIPFLEYINKNLEEIWEIKIEFYD